MKYRPFHNLPTLNISLFQNQTHQNYGYPSVPMTTRNRHQRIISIDSLRPSKKPTKGVSKKPSDDKSSIQFSCIVQQNSPVFDCSEYWEQKFVPRTSSKSECQNSDGKEQPYKIRFEENKRVTLQTQAFPLQSVKNPLTYSYSFDDSEQSSYEYQRRLFAKFLHSQNFQWVQTYSSMVETVGKQPKLLNFVKIGQNESTIEQNRILAHFIAIQLDSMEYHDHENRERIIENIQLMFNQNQGVRQIAEEIYTKLFQGLLPAELQIRVLLEVCRRGWEYFTFLCCRFIRLVMRRKTMSDIGGQLYNELEQIIINQAVPQHS